MAHISHTIGQRDVALLLRKQVSVVIENNYVAAIMYDRTQHGQEVFVLVRHGMSEFRSKFNTMEMSSLGTTVYEIVAGGRTVAKVAARTGRYYDAADRLSARWVRRRAQRQVLAKLKNAAHLTDQVCST